MIITAHDADGTPLDGLTLTWSVCVTASTGAAAGEPTFVPLGGGQYAATVPDTVTGIVDFGATARPRYVAPLPGTADGETVVAAFGADGSPLAGLTPTWLSWVAADGAGAALPQPTITELSGGLYRVDSPADGETGVLDFGATASPQTVTVGEAIEAGGGDTPTPSFPDGPLATWIEQAVTTIEGITPRTTGDGEGAVFVAVDGLLEIADEPQIRDRCFDVELVDSGQVEARWGDDYAQRLARIDVVLVYDRLTTRRAAMGRIHEDGFAITSRLEDSSSYGNTRIQRVTYLGGADITSAQSHRIDVRLPFEVLYLEPLT